MKLKTKFKETEIGRIPKDWDIKAIDEVAEVVGGGTPSTKNPEYWDGDIAWITPKDLSNFKFRYISRGERNITKKGLDNSSAKLVPENTVLLTTRAPVGYVAIAKNEVSTNQGFRSLISKSNTNPEFLFYLLKRNVEILKLNSTGTTFAELAGGRLKTLQFAFPNISEQSTIVKILSSLDSKIELNQNMNKILEEMNGTIFKHWFINFEFPNETEKPYKSSGGEMIYNDKLGSEIPKSWTVEFFGTVTKIVDFGSSGSFASLKNNIKFYYEPEYAILVRAVDFNNNWKGNYVYTNKHGYEFSSKSNLQPGDLMLSNIGNVGTPFFVPDLEKPMTCGKNVLLIKTDEFRKNFIFSYLLSDIGQSMIQSILTGSAVPKFNKTDLKNTKLILPCENIVKKFDKIASPIRKLIQKNEKEISILKLIRDSLLPKLMSGEISVIGVN